MAHRLSQPGREAIREDQTIAVRRRKGSPFEDLIGLVALLPWWAGVSLGLLGYVVLHHVASPTGDALQAAAAVAAKTGQTQPLILNAVVTGLATAGQYVVPLLCFVAAAVSFWRRRHRQALVAHVTQSPSAESLHDMTWPEFEQLVGEAFRLQGYQVLETGGGGADGGVDLQLRKGNETFLVQCKQWKALKVGVDVVRQLYGVMAARGAAGGFVVTSGTYTTDAITFAQGRNLTLVDGTRLHALLRQARHTQPGPLTSSHSAPPPAPVPPCPLCRGQMVRRVAKKGANAGRAFWGCAGFPGCRGVVSGEG